MENKLKNLRESMTETVFEDVTFDKALQRKIKEKALQQGLGRRKAKWGIARKMGVYTAAAAVLIGLFISSAYVSPAMAEVASKIPYVKLLFIKKDVTQLVAERLDEKKYKYDGIGLSYRPKKELVIQIPSSKEYYNRVKADVKKIAQDILDSQDYDAFTVNVMNFNPEPVAEEEDPKLLVLQTQIFDELKKQKFDVLSLYIVEIPDSGGEREVQVELADTEKRVAKLKELINKRIEAEQKETYGIKLQKVNLAKREQEGRWGSVISAMAQELMGKKDFQVKGLSYTVHPEPKLTIHTTVSAGDDHAKEYAQDLELIIHHFVTSDEMKEFVKGEPYELVINSKEKKQLN
ncbi:DUF4030 domain-containing protein [Peribacillus deserti]|uniref:DUF4179 domain-containing protein n=1 Tax=Peribacillus deserti TaxID=673318 RepID=A0A2N5M9K8_9BACI|nr:DUF4030 domain-containing protein [Peribacillus deserti]PLT31037.1 hypothetical protein CUU66_04325 [Peribacillus deserti]